MDTLLHSERIAPPYGIVRGLLGIETRYGGLSCQMETNAKKDVEQPFSYLVNFHRDVAVNRM